MSAKRSRNGCWTCREKRRKCDEAKPHCVNCRTRGVKCGGYDIRLSNFQIQSGYRGQMVGRLSRSFRESSSTPALRNAHQPSMQWRKSHSHSDQGIEGTLSIVQFHTDSNPGPRTATEPAAPTSYNNSQTDFLAQSSECAQPRRSDAPNAALAFASTPQGDGVRASYYIPLPANDPAGYRMTSQDLIFDFDPCAPGLDFDFDTTLMPEHTSHSRLDFDSYPPDEVPMIDIMPPTGSTSSSHAPLTPKMHDDVEEILLDEQYLSREGFDMYSCDNSACKIVTPKPNVGDQTTPTARQELAPHLTGSPAAGHLSAAQMLDRQAQGCNDLEKIERRSCKALTSPRLQTTPLSISSPLSPSDFPSPFEHYLYKHYVSVLAPNLNPYPGAKNPNPYQLIYAAATSSSKPLKDAISCAAAFHLCAMGQLPMDVAQLYREALENSIEKALQSTEQHYATMAAVLLAATAGLIGFDNTAYMTELRKFQNPLTTYLSLLKEGQSSFTIRYLRLQFNWITALAQTTWQPCRPCQDMVQLDCLELGTGTEADMFEVHLYWFRNLPDYAIYKHLRIATRLSQKISSKCLTQVDTAGLQELIVSALDLVTDIRNITPNISAVPESLTKFADAVNEIWIQGLLCYVYQTICGLKPTEPRIKECVRLAVNALEILPWKQSVIWPIFMIGVQASSADDQNVIAESLRSVNAKLNLTSTMSALSFLQEVWTDMDQNGCGTSRWQEMMITSGTQLNLLL